MSRSPATPDARAERALEFYRTMLTIRRFEQRACALYQEGAIRGVIHPYLGEEAIATGVCAALKPTDYVVSTHRGHGHCLAKGASPARMMAELLGRQDGYCRGKGGSMHLAAFEVGMLGAIGVVAAGIPIAVGAGISALYRESGQVSVCFFGDGGVNQGAFHEGLNLASVWKLPVIFVCENNLYAISTHMQHVSAVSRVADRSCAYDVPGVQVDGNAVWEVHRVARTAVERARAGDGPTLIEALTYRHTGHYVGDPGHYRPAGELDEWKARDPLSRLRNQGLEQEWFTSSELEEVAQEVSQEIEDAVAAARRSPLPPASELTQHVFGSW